MATEIPKGLKLMLGMVGITPEMLQNPQSLLKQFGINADDVLNKVAEFQQIGLRIERAFVENNIRLARIEAHLGIVPDDAGTGGDFEGGDGGELPRVGQRPPDRRN